MIDLTTIQEPSGLQGLKKISHIRLSRINPTRLTAAMKKSLTITEFFY